MLGVLKRTLLDSNYFADKSMNFTNSFFFLDKLRGGSIRVTYIRIHMVLTFGGSTNSSSEEPTFSLYEYIQTNIHIKPKEPNR